MAKDLARACCAAGCLGLVVLLVSCQPPISPVIPDPSEAPAIPNAVPPDASEDVFPLFVGARWVYRDATPDYNPEVHALPGIEVEVEAIVRVHADGTAPYECYVLKGRQGSGPEVRSYLHRTSTGVGLYGVEVAPYVGSHEPGRFAGEEVMRLPLEKSLTWGFADPSGASLASVVVGQEWVPLSGTVWTLLGPYTSTFGDAWRVKSEFGGMLEDAYGQGVVEVWYAPGVGMVRRTADSHVYELVQYRRFDEVTLLGETSDDGPYALPVGAVVVVQLRGSGTAASSGYAWELANEGDVSAGGVLSLLSSGREAGEFFADLAGTERLDRGSYVFVFEVLAQAEATLEFTRWGFGDAASAAVKTVRFEFGNGQPPS